MRILVRGWFAIALSAVAITCAATPPASAEAAESALMSPLAGGTASERIALGRIDFAALLEPAEVRSADPQQVSTVTAGATVAFTGEPDAQIGPPSVWRNSAAAATVAPDLDLSDTPMAPLPPAIVAGPITLAFATWLAHRIKRRGGRV